MGSFRSALALRVFAQALVVAAVGIAGSAALLRRDLIRGLDATLLGIAEIVARAHDGTLEFVGNDPGAAFRMTLPAAG